MGGCGCKKKREEVKPRPQVTVTTKEGNGKLSEKDLADKITVKLKEIYRESGYIK